MTRPALRALLAVSAMLYAALAYAQPAASPYERLVDVFLAPEVQQRAVEAVLAATREQFLAQPNVAAMESDCPGTIDALMQGFASWALAGLAADSGAYRERMVGFLRERMPEDQAAEAAGFFESALGQRVLRVVSGEMSFEQTLASGAADEEGRFSREAFDADRAEITARSLGQMTPAELEALEQAMGSSAWGVTFQRLLPELQQLRFEEMNAPATPEEDAAMERIIAAAVDAHLAQCDGSLAAE
jgi:hypothetical protein